MKVACGIILAGGRGERFGRPKAVAQLPDGRTFLIACRDLLAAGGCDPIVATLPPGSPPAGIAGVECAALPALDLEMFDSLRFALERALTHPRWRVAVVLPVDHPLVAPATVCALIAAEAMAALPLHAGKHGHPVAIAREMGARIAAGELAGPTLRDALHAVGTADVAVDDPGVRANCNTPEALASAWRRLDTPGRKDGHA